MVAPYADRSQRMPCTSLAYNAPARPHRARQEGNPATFQMRIWRAGDPLPSKLRGSGSAGAARRSAAWVSGVFARRAPPGLVARTRHNVLPFPRLGAVPHTLPLRHARRPAAQPACARPAGVTRSAEPFQAQHFPRARATLNCFYGCRLPGSWGYNGFQHLAVRVCTSKVAAVVQVAQLARSWPTVAIYLSTVATPEP